VTESIFAKPSWFFDDFGSVAPVVGNPLSDFAEATISGELSPIIVSDFSPCVEENTGSGSVNALCQEINCSPAANSW
jgi:hypothetical protein